MRARWRLTMTAVAGGAGGLGARVGLLLRLVSGRRRRLFFPGVGGGVPWIGRSCLDGMAWGEGPVRLVMPPGRTLREGAWLGRFGRPETKLSGWGLR